MALAVATCGCFERPISRDVEVRFPADGSAEISIETRLTAEDDLLKNPAVAERVEAETRELLDGRDPWSRQLAGLSAQREILVQEKAQGRLVRVRRTARLADPETLGEAFAASGVAASFERHDGVSEFALYASDHPLATEAERARFREAMGPWLDALSRWFTAASALWEYLDANPDRAEACFGRYFRNNLGERCPEAPEATGEEAALVDALDEAGGPLSGVLEIKQNEAMSLDELAQKLHDPLPGRLTVKIEGEVLESEGLEPAPDGGLRAPSLGLWDAFERIAARRLSPNPLAALVARLRHPEDEAPFPLEEFCSRPRFHADAPGPEDLRADLARELTPPPVYRARFRLAAAPPAVTP